MKSRFTQRHPSSYVELPTGIFTADGIWFHTSEKLLQDYAGEVIEIVGMEKILKEAVIWARCSEPVSSLFLLGMLLFVDPIVAGISAVALYFAWYRLSPVFANPRLSRVLMLLSSTIVQGGLFVIGLSWLARQGNFEAVGVGLVGFVLLRWGLVGRLAGSGLNIGQSNQLPRPDRILRNLIVRHAISARITLPAVESFESRIAEIWQLRQRK